MSAQVQAVAALIFLAIVAGAVLMWMFWPTNTRIAEAQLEAQRRRQQQLDELAKREAALAAAHAADVPAPANWHSGEHHLVERPPGDADAWMVQEKVAPAEVVDEPVEPEAVVEPEPEEPLFADEPTPLFAATGDMPVLERLESHTDCWNRDGLLERIRRLEFDAAKSWRDEVRAEVAENPEYVSGYVDTDRDRGVRTWPSCAGPRPEELLPDWAHPVPAKLPHLVTPGPLVDPAMVGESDV